MKKTIALFLILGMLACLLSSCVEPEVRETDPDTESPTTGSVEPSEQPNAPTVEPTESAGEPTESEPEPTKSEIEPTESEIEPTESEIEPTESEIEPTESEIEPTESEIEPTESEPEPSASIETPPSTDVEDADYEVVVRDGRCYIVFDDASVYDDQELEEGFLVAGLWFNSVSEMRDTILNGALSLSQRKFITVFFEKDDFGFPIYDMNRLYVIDPALEVPGDGVTLQGECYYFTIDMEQIVVGGIFIYTKERYDFFFQRDYVNYFDREDISVISVDETEDGKTVTTYRLESGTKRRRVRYQLLDGEKTVTVDKEYGANADVPLTINLYYDCGDVLYKVYLYWFEEEPADEWLLSFEVFPLE